MRLRLHGHPRTVVRGEDIPRKPPHTLSVPTGGSCVGLVLVPCSRWVVMSLPVGGSELWVVARLMSVIGIDRLNVSLSLCGTGDADVITTSREGVGVVGTTGIWE